MTRPRGAWVALGGVSLAFGGCLRTPTTAPSANSPLASIEQAFQSARYWEDQLRLTESLGRDTLPNGVTASAIQDSLRTTRQRYRAQLHAPRPPLRTAADSAALALLHGAAAAANADAQTVNTAPTAARDALAVTVRTVMTAYSRAANRIVINGDTLNRLSILGLLSRTNDPALRKQLFLALDPVWRSINHDNGATSPYRTMLRLRTASWGDTASPIERKGLDFGLTATQVETWLTDALGAWRAAMPDTMLEPWDWYHFTGAASRRLSPRIADITDIRRVNDAFFEALGASPNRLRIAYDLEPRAGKYPVAFTDFGTRNRWLDERLVAGSPWVFASYLTGGFDNLSELLHETGHGIHIAGIRTRPAFIDWPDNDTFTEALADVAALELYEPAWQHRFLGDSATLAESLRAKYAGIVFDMAWALLEIRVHRTPGADPNQLWTDITSQYLRIRPHPEWSWWAMRGQLIEEPGYLINYALGAFLVADMRARMTEQWGSFSTPSDSRYEQLTEHLYRFGRERSSRRVLEDFLGRAPRPDALFRDLRRMSR
ncbi:MAG: hypothetical protein ABMA00_02025 [Gemmatimonas sp.]